VPERGFATETWTEDSWFQRLNQDQRYLFIYLWTNNHCKQAGVYSIPVSTMSFETKIDEDKLLKLLNELSPKVGWYPEQEIVWVKSFIKRQLKSPKFLIAAAKSLATINNNGLVQEVIEYNQKRYNISIPYQYSIDTIQIKYRDSIDTSLTPNPNPNTNTNTNTSTSTSKQIGGSRGEGDLLARMSTKYEAEIGVITSVIATELWDFSEHCESRKIPIAWIDEAFTEAAKHNKRSWSYVKAILNEWIEHGRGRGRKGRISENDNGISITNCHTHQSEYQRQKPYRKAAQDPDKYTQGKFGGMVKR
jgi:DnaD/phage-associated family protein